MSRLIYPVLFAFILSLSAVGCGGSENTVIEDTRSEAEIDQEEADYEEMMNEAAESDVSQ